MVFLLRIHTSNTQMTGKTTVMIVADVNEPMFRPSTDLGRNRQLARGSTIDCADIRGLGPVRSHANNGEHYLPAEESLGQRHPGRERELKKTSNSIELFLNIPYSLFQEIPYGFQRSSSYALCWFAGCVFRLKPCFTLQIAVIYTDFVSNISVATTAVTQRCGPFFLLYEALFVD